MIPIAGGIQLDEKEIVISFVRAPGPGGQNVNKTATAAQLRFNARYSPSLPEEVRQRLTQLAGNRISAAGEIIIEARRFRGQEANRRDAMARLEALIRRAAARPRPRRKTKPTAASRERRLAIKRCRGNAKALRRAPELEE